MSATNVQTVNENELYNVKILYILTKQYNIKPIFNKNGTFSFKRHNIDQQSEYQYLYAKCLKNINVRTREQLNLLFNDYSSELLIKTVNLGAELNTAPMKTNSVYKTYSKEIKAIKPIFDNYIRKRERFIMTYGIVAKSVKMNPELHHFYDTSYGKIDYYNGIILLANLNVNVLGKLLIENNKRVILTDKNGFFFVKNKGGYVEIYDLKHKNTIFKVWKCKDNPKIFRLYYTLNNNQKYIALVEDKLKFNFVCTNTNYYTLLKRIVDKY